MKTESVNGKPNRLRRILPVLALAAGLALPAVAYALDNCEDCLSSCDITFQDSLWHCYHSPSAPPNCIEQASQNQLQCRNECYTYVCAN